MNKTILLALAVLVSAALSAETADKKDKKKKGERIEQTATEAPLSLLTTADSTSYAAGVASTQGLLPYLERNIGLDTMFMKDFRRGFFEAIERGTDPKYVAFTAGQQIAQQVQKQIFPQQAATFKDTPDSLNAETFCRGFADGAAMDTSVFKVTTAQAYVKARQSEAVRMRNADYIAENTKWLEDNKSNEGVVVLPSGLQYKVLTEGTGAVPTEDDKVVVRYEGKLIDGTVFDSSNKRDTDTATFKPTQVIKGWTEALLMMPVGSKWELYIPEALGYGERQSGKIKPFSTLIFTVETVGIEE